MKLDEVADALARASADDALKMVVGVFAAILLASQENAVASPDECSHRVQVALNDSCAICLVCRTKIEGPTSFGILLTGAEVATALDNSG